MWGGDDIKTVLLAVVSQENQEQWNSAMGDLGQESPIQRINSHRGSSCSNGRPDWEATGRHRKLSSVPVLTSACRGMESWLWHRVAGML